MMAMFGWTDPKMPAHYIAKAKREKLGMSGMEKIVAFDESHSLDELMALPNANIDRTAAENRVVTLRVILEKKRRKFRRLSVGMVRSEGGRICCDINDLQAYAKSLGVFRAQRYL
jgi:hypothetical protein